MVDYTKMSEEQILADMARNTICTIDSSTLDSNYVILSDYLMKDYLAQYEFIMSLRANVLISILKKYDDFTKLVLDNIINGEQSVSSMANTVFSVLVDKLVEFYEDDSEKLLAFFTSVKEKSKLTYNKKIKAIKKKTLKKLSHILTLLLF